MSSVTFPTAIGGDGSTVTDDDNATTGLRNGGWRTRFIPCFTNLVNIANYVVTYTASTTAFATPPPMGSTTPNTGAFTRVTVTGSTAPANGMYLPGTNILGFATNSTERVRIDASGNFGLGVAPSAWSSAFKVIQYFGGFAGSQSNAYLYSGQNAYFDGTNWKRVAAGYASLFEQSNGQFLFYTAGTSTAGSTISFTQTMTLDASGNLIVGYTGSTSYKLYVSRGGTAGALAQFTDGTAQTITLDTTATGASIANPNAGYLSFGTNGSERARIDLSGNFYVGGTIGGAKLNVFGGCRFLALETAATTYSGIGSIVGDNVSISTVGLERLRVSNGGAVYVYSLGTGTVYSSGSILTNTNPSDERLKEDVATISYGLAEVNKLNPVTFKFKNDPEEVKKLSWGFIAQEVQPIMPQLVTTFQQDDEEYLGLEINGIYTILVKAIQELSAELNELKQRIH